MIASKDSFEPHSSEQLPASKKVFVAGTIHPDVQVPMREIQVSDTKSYTGAVTSNAPVRVYDCSGPWGDPAFTGTSDEGLPAMRREWILKRGDVEEVDGREVKPQDDGYLSGKHAEFASKAEKNPFAAHRRQPFVRRASKGRVAPRPTAIIHAHGRVRCDRASVRFGVAHFDLAHRHTDFGMDRPSHENFFGGGQLFAAVRFERVFGCDHKFVF